jgi:hypothetical protein
VATEERVERGAITRLGGHDELVVARLMVHVSPRARRPAR